jgi:type IV fimbrial biogenesis protein FimT
MLVTAVRLRAQGFTLVELMVGITVLAILSAIAVPSFGQFIASQRLRAASFDLHTDLKLARSEALKRNQNITIRRREAAGWQTGWVIVTAADETLRSRNALGAGVSVASPAAAIIFNGNGRVVSPAGTVQIGLTAASGSTHFDRCLVLNPSGMPSTYAEACT